MKKICIFTAFYPPHLGGVERYTEEIVKELVKSNSQITIVTTNDNNYPEYEKKENIIIYRLPVYKTFKNRYPIIKTNKKYREIINKIKSLNFDAYVCQTRFYLTTQIGVKIANNHNKKALIIEHGSSHFTVNNKILDFFGAKYEHFLTNRIKKKNVRFYGVSKSCNEWLKHFKIVADGVLYNSISDEIYDTYKNKHYFSKKEKNKIYIGYIGRIIKEKGVDLLLESVSELSKNYKNMELFIAGNGPEIEKYKTKYNNKNIHFLGVLSYDEVLKLCNDLDIFVHPSMYPEGLPTSILEAGLMKCAIIATNRGGTIEVINSKDMGLIMDENINSLKDNLKYLLDNNSKIKEYKENIHKRIINNFTWKITSQKLLKEVNNERD